MEFNFFSDYFQLQTKLNQVDLDGSQDTLKQLAKRIGYNSPSLLSMVSKGERLPSNALLDALLNEWNVSSSDAAIVKLKVAIEKKKRNEQDHLELAKELNRLQKKIGYQQTSLEEFEMISEWYILVLRSMIGTELFNQDPNELSVILRRKISPAKIKHGIDVLLKIGLVKRNLETGLLEQNQKNIESVNNIPSEAIRNHHRQMIQRAIESIDEQSINERTLNSLTINFEVSRYKEAQNKIWEFIKNFNEEFGQNSSDHIYQLNLQFFQHTNSKKLKKDSYEPTIN